MKLNFLFAVLFVALFSTSILAQGASEDLNIGTEPPDVIEPAPPPAQSEYNKFLDDLNKKNNDPGWGLGIDNQVPYPKYKWTFE